MEIERTTRQFLCDLTTTPVLPNHSWLLATLPVRSGGLGLLAPSSQALLSFIRPLARTIRYSIHGIPITNFLTNATPPTPNAPPPAPSH
jgi:hypothetical protein